MPYKNVKEDHHPVSRQLDDQITFLRGIHLRGDCRCNLRTGFFFLKTNTLNTLQSLLSDNLRFKTNEIV